MKGVVNSASVGHRIASSDKSDIVSVVKSEHKLSQYPKKRFSSIGEGMSLYCPLPTCRERPRQAIRCEVSEEKAVRQYHDIFFLSSASHTCYRIGIGVFSDPMIRSDPINIGLFIGYLYRICRPVSDRDRLSFRYPQDELLEE